MMREEITKTDLSAAGTKPPQDGFIIVGDNSLGSFTSRRMGALMRSDIKRDAPNQSPKTLSADELHVVGVVENFFKPGIKDRPNWNEFKNALQTITAKIASPDGLTADIRLALVECNILLRDEVLTRAVKSKKPICLPELKNVLIENNKVATAITEALLLRSNGEMRLNDDAKTRGIIAEVAPDFKKLIARAERIEQKVGKARCNGDAKGILNGVAQFKLKPLCQKLGEAVSKFKVDLVATRLNGRDLLSLRHRSWRRHESLETRLDEICATLEKRLSIDRVLVLMRFVEVLFDDIIASKAKK